MRDRSKLHANKEKPSELHITAFHNILKESIKTYNGHNII